MRHANRPTLRAVVKGFKLRARLVGDNYALDLGDHENSILIGLSASDPICVGRTFPSSVMNAWGFSVACLFRYSAPPTSSNAFKSADLISAVILFTEPFGLPGPRRGAVAENDPEFAVCIFAFPKVDARKSPAARDRAGLSLGRNKEKRVT